MIYDTYLNRVHCPGVYLYPYCWIKVIFLCAPVDNFAYILSYCLYHRMYTVHVSRNATISVYICHPSAIIGPALHQALSNRAPSANMCVEEATRTAAIEAFQERAARHYRNAIRLYIQHIRFAIAFILIATVTCILLVDKFRTSSSRRLSSALQNSRLNNLHCDDSLGRRHLWFLQNAIGNDMCVLHADVEASIPPASNAEPGIRFFVLGDWGRDGMCCQRDVAHEMAFRARRTKPNFIASVGDNFYLNGIVNSEDGQIKRSWLDVYIQPFESLRLPWKMTLGNHDHQGNADAQTVVGRENAYWHMPKKYYFETVGDIDNQIFFAFIDTTVMYYTEEEFDMFNGEISMRYRDDQVATIRKQLADSKAKWKVVIGHHPLISSGENAYEEERNLKQMRTMLLHIFKEHGVAAYFCGHEHTMEHLLLDNVHLFISGTGSKLSEIKSSHEESIFTLDRQGFLDVVIRNDSDRMTVRMVDLFGSVVHVANISRPTLPSTTEQ